MANELALNTTLNKTSIPVTRTQQLVYVLVEAKPSEIVARTRMGVNFGFVLDRSGSMRGNKIDRLKEAMTLAMVKMAPDDLVSVTVFSDKATVLAASGPLSNQSSVIQRIKRLRAAGGTQMSRGISLGLREIYQRFSEDRVNQLLLLTDGQTYGDEA
jgi:Ca-activated chloride channel family protein